MDVDDKRTITVGRLVASDGVADGCSSLLGKFKVTEFKATSWHGSEPEPSTTVSTSYFYIGARGMQGAGQLGAVSLGLRCTQ